MSDNRIETAKNRVFYGDGLGIGRNNPNSLHTVNTSIYRVTGMGQVTDIINCGYVRPKEGRIKGGHENEVFWSLGGDKTFYYDKRPVLETNIDVVKDGQIGSLSLDDLKAIWLFDYDKNKYVNKIETIRQFRERVKITGNEISKDTIVETFRGIPSNYKFKDYEKPVEKELTENTEVIVDMPKIVIPTEEIIEGRSR